MSVVCVCVCVCVCEFGVGRGHHRQRPGGAQVAQLLLEPRRWLKMTSLSVDSQSAKKKRLPTCVLPPTLTRTLYSACTLCVCVCVCVIFPCHRRRRNGNEKIFLFLLFFFHSQRKVTKHRGTEWGGKIKTAASSLAVGGFSLGFLEISFNLIKARVIWSEFAGFYWVLLGFTGLDWAWLGFTGFRWVLEQFTEL